MKLTDCLWNRCKLYYTKLMHCFINRNVVLIRHTFILTKCWCHITSLKWKESPVDYFVVTGCNCGGPCNHRPYSRQVTERMGCNVVIHPPPSIYPKAGNGALQDQWVSEWFSLTAFFRTADIEVHIVHTSRVIIAYTLKSLSSLT